jgi:hypothetical protein
MASIEIELSPKIQNPDAPVLPRKFPMGGRSLTLPSSIRPGRPRHTIRYSGTPEYASVNTHHQSMKTSYKSKHATYRGMVFYEGWDPDKGGTYVAGAKWIIENLGRKPSRDYELHIVDRRLGFVPGNLAWVPRSEHKREEMLTKLLIENQQLKDRLAKYESS